MEITTKNNIRLLILFSKFYVVDVRGGCVLAGLQAVVTYFYK